MASIMGDAGDNDLQGTSGADSIRGLGGDDTIQGLAGPDSLYGGAGRDWIEGGLGGDLIYGEDQADTLFGGEGADTVYGIFGNDRLYGGDGADWLADILGANLVKGEAGDDVLHVSGVGTGGPGVDMIEAEGFAVRIRGGGGDDSILLIDPEGGEAHGGKDDDEIVYTQYDRTRPEGSALTLDGGAGVDRFGVDLLRDIGPTIDLRGLDGGGEASLASGLTLRGFEAGKLAFDNAARVLIGATDIDIEGSDHADTVEGGHGRSSIRGGEGDDELDGGAGDDTLSGGAGHDTITGGEGRDLLLMDGGRIDLRITDARQPDVVSGIEDVMGTTAANLIIGDAGANRLVDSPHYLYDWADTLDGGGGEDTLVAFIGLQRDRLTGGAGSDTFGFVLGYEFHPHDASRFDLVTDLEASDVIDVSAIDAKPGEAGDQAFEQVKNFTGYAGQLGVSYDAASGRTLVQLGLDATRGADAIILLDGDHAGFANFVL